MPAASTPTMMPFTAGIAQEERQERPPSRAHDGGDEDDEAPPCARDMSWDASLAPVLAVSRQRSRTTRSTRSAGPSPSSRSAQRAHIHANARARLVDQIAAHAPRRGRATGRRASIRVAAAAAGIGDELQPQLRVGRQPRRERGEHVAPVRREVRLPLREAQHEPKRPGARPARGRHYRRGRAWRRGGDSRRRGRGAAGSAGAAAGPWPRPAPSAAARVSAAARATSGGGGGLQRPAKEDGLSLAAGGRRRVAERAPVDRGSRAGGGAIVSSAFQSTDAPEDGCGGSAASTSAGAAEERPRPARQRAPRRARRSGGMKR